MAMSFGGRMGWLRPVARDVRRLARALPGGLLLAGLVLDQAATGSSGGLAHGFQYQHQEVPEVPWSIHIVKVDRANPDFELQSSLGGGDRVGLATLSSMMRAWPTEAGRPVAAINGDYYYGGPYRRYYPYPGDPKGLQILRGELVSGPCDWTCFWIDSAGAPHTGKVVSHFEAAWPTGEKTPLGLNEERTANAAVLFTAAIGFSTRTTSGRDLVLERNGTNDWLPLEIGRNYSARVREVREAGNALVDKHNLVLSLGYRLAARAPKIPPGAILQISTATAPDLRGARMAIGGGPALVRGGRALKGLDDWVRHPRTAVGWNQRYYFMVEVDGRQLNLSVGMTLPELAEYMVKLGCDEAMAFDGGGSATCWVYGQVMNSPSEGRERPMANGLLLVQRTKK